MLIGQGPPKRAPRINFKKIQIDILCEWFDCKFLSTDLSSLQDHLINHLRNLCNQPNSSNGINCGICTSALNTDFSSLRHMYYHAYHLYLKCRGKYVMDAYKLKECSLDSESSNAIPWLMHPFICQWDQCKYSSDNISEFYDHIEYHPIAEMDNDVNTKTHNCRWSNCKYATKTSHQLQGHLSLHCEKRHIACPGCGLCFSSTSKFTDHLKRQLVSVWNKQMQDEEMTEVLSTLASTCNPVIPLPKPIVAPPPEAYKCNLCMHLFATKRLLKDHETRHILSVSCTHCSHTCASRYALKRHILFRHTEEKPFKCSNCEMGFKCNDGLKRHLISIHGDNTSFYKVHCDVQDCDYVAQNKRALNIHKSRIHCKVQTIVTKVYVCHKCEQEYVKGTHLTEHFTKEHGINRTSSRYRHQYKISEDGKYRLNMFDLKLKTAINERNGNYEDESASMFLAMTENVDEIVDLKLRDSFMDDCDDDDDDDNGEEIYGDYLSPNGAKMENFEVVDVID